MSDALERILDDLPTLRRTLERARKKFISYNGPNGTVKVNETEAVEVARIGCHVPPKKRVPLKEMDRAFRASSVGAGLREVLEAVGGPLVTREEAERAEMEEWRRFRSRILESALEAHASGHAERWLSQDAAYLKQASRSSEAEWVFTVIGALGELPRSGPPLPLAYFATQTTGNAHTFDSDRPAGRMLLRALGAIVDGWEIRSSLDREDREDLLSQVGLLLDDLSSDVLVAGLVADVPYLKDAAVRGHPLTIPLFTIERLSDIRPVTGRTVFAVENPQVFRILLERSGRLSLDARPALLCTSGRPSLAARRLIGRMVAEGIQIRYSGDFDPDGIDIAFRLLERHPDHVELWRMGVEDHAFASETGRAGPGLSEECVARVAAHDQDLARALRRGTAHQEALVERLWEDLQEHSRGPAEKPQKA